MRLQRSLSLIAALTALLCAQVASAQAGDPSAWSSDPDPFQAPPFSQSIDATWTGSAEGRSQAADDTTDGPTDPGPVQRTLTVIVTGAGTVTSAPEGIDCPSACEASFADGASVTLTATPGPRAVFRGWSGPSCSGNGPCVVTMSQARSVTATFADVVDPGQALRTTVVGRGDVTFTPVGVSTCGADCLAYPTGTEVTLDAVPEAGFAFEGWSGDCATSVLSCTVRMTEARFVTARFTAPPPPPRPPNELLVGLDGSGSGRVTSAPGGIDCGTTCEAFFSDDTTVTLTATPDATSTFTGWSGAGCGGAGACVVAMSEEREVTAEFARVPQRFRVTVDTFDGEGTGRVTSSPPGIDCAARCSAEFVEGTVVTLTATPDPHMRIERNGCGGTTPTCAVTIGQNEEFDIRFAPIRHFLDVARGSGGGDVVSEPAPFACESAPCPFWFLDGSEVTLIPRPQEGFEFAYWTHDCTGSGACTVTMDSNRFVVAYFRPIPPQPVTITIEGRGRVDACGASATGCTLTRPFGQTTLNATEAGDVFVGWSGSCEGQQACKFLVDRPEQVTARFLPSEQTRALTVRPVGSAFSDNAARVLSTPAAVVCPPKCNVAFATGTSVDLRIEKHPLTNFYGWSGACSGDQLCSVAMTDARTVDATVIGPPQERELQIAKTGAGTGTVTSSPGTLNCGSVCRQSFSEYARITLTATPAPGSRFAGWPSGHCSATPPTPTCSVAMSVHQNVSARFDPIPNSYRLTVIAPPEGGRIVSQFTTPVISCPPVCTANYDAGTRVVLGNQLDPGWLHDGWVAPSPQTCIAGGPNRSCDFNIAADTTVQTKLKAGAGTLPNVTLLPGSAIDFGDIEIGANEPALADLTIVNNGSARPDTPDTLKVSDFALSGPDAAQFRAFARDGMQSCSLVPQRGACVVRIAALATAVATPRARLTVNSNAESSPLVVDIGASVVAHPILVREPEIIDANPRFRGAINAHDAQWRHAGALRRRQEWLRCQPRVGGDCTKVAEGTTAYTLQEGDIGHRMRFSSIVTDDKGTSGIFSQPSAIVEDLEFPLDIEINDTALGSVYMEGACIDNQLCLQLIGRERSSTCLDVSCRATARAGRTVRLEANPERPTDGSEIRFIGWSGDCSGADPVCEVTLDGARRASAEFRRRPPPDQDDPENYFNKPALDDIKACSTNGVRNQGFATIKQAKVGRGRVSSACAIKVGDGDEGRLSPESYRLLRDNRPWASAAQAGAGFAFSPGPINTSSFLLERVQTTVLPAERYQVIRGAGNSVLLNGLVFKPEDGHDIIIDRESQLLVSRSASIYVPLPFVDKTVKIWDHDIVVFDLRINGPKFLQDAAGKVLGFQFRQDSNFPKLPAGLKIPLALEFPIRLGDVGDVLLDMQLHLPPFFSVVGNLPVSFTATLGVDDRDGLSFKGARARIGTNPRDGQAAGDVGRIGPPGLNLGIKYLDVEYQAPDLIRGAIDLAFGPVGVDAALRLRGSKLEHLFIGAHSSTPPLAVIGPGVFLTDIGGGFTNDESKLELEAALGIAVGLTPGSERCPPAKIDATGRLRLDPKPYEIELRADVSLFCLKVGNARVFASFNGFGSGAQARLNVDLQVGYDFRVFAIKGGLHGAFESSGNWELGLNGQITFVGLKLFGGSFFASNTGVAGCISPPWPIPDLGAGVRWPEGSNRLLFLNPATAIGYIIANADWTGCDFSKFKTVRASAAQADGGRTVTVPSGERAVEIVVHGADSAPDVTVSGPEGTEPLTPPATGMFRRADGAALRNEPGKVAIAVFVKPKGGTYTITPAPGSPTITRVEVAGRIPEPVVKARLTRQGDRYKVRYDVKAIPGQVVRITEAAPNSEQALATVTGGGAGTVTFLPGDAPGTKRTIVAHVIQDGLPRAKVTLQRFRAGPPMIGHPGPVIARRKGRKLVVNWRPGRNAQRHLVGVTLSDGRSFQRDPGAKNHLVVPNVAAATSARIVVVGLRGNREGKAARVKVKAVNANKPRKPTAKRKPTKRRAAPRR